MKQYTQLSQEERYNISAAVKSKTPKAQLAREIGRHRSTIYRELKRNKGQRGYRPKQAHELAQQRCYRKTSEFTDFALAYIEHLIHCNWSPEQIAGRLQQCGWLDVPSHEWIYQYIYQQQGKGNTMHKHLRCQKTYRKRGFKSNDRRGQIANKTSIHCRDAVIENRERLGDFEGDTIIGKHHKGALLTLVERKSLYTHIVFLGATRVSSVTIANCISRLKLSNAYSVTFDNGKEFAEHERLQQRGIDTYFADPYKSIQRARNENTNGLIRYEEHCSVKPKSSSFDDLSHEQIQQIEDALNNRPRKSLGWLTPNEVMASFYTVALAS